MDKRKRMKTSYNPQLGYLKTTFDGSIDFLTDYISYHVEKKVIVMNVRTYLKKVATVYIQVISEDSYRLQMFQEGNTDIFMNSVINPIDSRDAIILDEEDKLIVSFGTLKIIINKYPWQILVYKNEKIVLKEQISDSNVDNMCKYPQIGFEYSSDGEVIAVNETMNLHSDEQFYGFGEQFTQFNKRGEKINCWQSDALCTNSEESYKNHPFFMSSRGYGILVNSYTKMSFDMGRTSAVSYQMKVQDCYLDYIVYLGEDYKAVLKNYLQSIGPIPQIPRWAFGLWMSKCTYSSQKEVEDVIARAEKEHVKIDVVHIDEWQQKDLTGAWVWDDEAFPRPQEMIDEMKKKGIRVSLWMYPYITEESPMFDDLEEKGFLVKDINTGRAIKFSPMATVSYKVGCFDFTNPACVEWYSDRAEKIFKMGIDVLKTDFSEAIPDTASYFDGSNGLQGHNKIPLLYAKTIYEAMKRVKDEVDELPMLWGRSGYSGSHMYPAAWAGDSSSTLNNHACILRGGLSLGLSGIAYWGFDLGGFYNTDEEGYECVPTDEEYLRSIAFGFFSPLSRCHGKTPREPWNFSDRVQQIFHKFNDIRHELIPYLYSASIESAKTYVPMMRALLLEYPNDRVAQHIDLQYMLGAELLVAPVFDQQKFSVYLPEGIWYDFFTGRSYVGSRFMDYQTSLDSIPVFQRDNSVIAKDISGRLNATIAMSGEVKSVFYDEDGCYNITAIVEERALIIISEKEFDEYRIITALDIKEANVNGKSIELEKTEYGYCIRL